MKIRFGYVSHAISLWDASPAKTVTYTRYCQLGKEKGGEKLLEATAENLKHTRRMLYYNLAHEIELYRFSSSLVPLATHPEIRWDFLTPFRSEWREIGELVRKNGLRVSFHPNQFTLFTSPKKSITENATIDMDYHYRMLAAMGVKDSGLINIHIGGAYGNKGDALARFYENLEVLPAAIKNIMTLENDDKTYNAAETLAACEQIGVPFVFDYHHHLANPGTAPLEELFPRLLHTWSGKGMPPKIHLSSPKSAQKFRSHADFVNAEFVMPCLRILQKLGRDVDIMIEAKAKDQALLRLVEELSKLRGIKRLRGGVLEMK